MTIDILRQMCIDYFGNDDWMYVRHPLLFYISPIKYLNDGGDVERVSQVLIRELGWLQNCVLAD